MNSTRIQTNSQRTRPLHSDPTMHVQDTYVQHMQRMRRWMRVFLHIEEGVVESYLEVFKILFQNGQV